jgi:hypothetical protein
MVLGLSIIKPDNSLAASVNINFTEILCMMDAVKSEIVADSSCAVVALM